MMMLKTAWNEVSSKTIVNCFRKSGISEDARKAAIDYQDDPFKDMINDAEDESADGEENEAIDELQFDLDQLRKVRPDMAPEDLDADSLVDFDIQVTSNESRPLSVAEIVSDYQAVEIVDASSDEDECPEDDDPVLPPSQNEIEGAIETLKKLTLFSNDSELDPLVLIMSKKINQRRLNQMKQSSITDFFEKN